MGLHQRNNVNVMGDGPSTLVFSHGFGCNQAMWNYLAPQFFEHFRVVMYDLVGAGLSDLNAFDKAKYSALDGYAPSRSFDHAYWSGNGPCSMHIEEVEAIWAPIADADDWTLLENKVLQIRQLGEAMS